MKFKIAMSHFYVPTQEWVEGVGRDPHYIHFGSGPRLHRTKNQWVKDHIVLDDSLPDNIADRNWSYSELSNLYFLWKNIDKFIDSDTEFIGLCHYRRWWDTDKLEQVVEKMNPDIVCAPPAGIGMYDIETQYRLAHSGEDFNMLVGYMKESFLHHQNREVLPMWMKFHALVAPYNLLVMKKPLFNEWCERLFPVLDDIWRKHRVEYSKRDNYQRRAVSFMGERFSSWFVTQKAADGAKVVQMPIIFDADAKPADATDIRVN